MSEAASHFSYLLRIWQVPTNDEHVWRIHLENVQTGEKYGFTSLEDLSAYLSHKAMQENETSGERSQTEMQGRGEAPAPPYPASGNQERRSY